jgi:hypothetical protein
MVMRISSIFWGFLGVRNNAAKLIKEKKHLSKHKISFCQLHEHVLRPERVVELQLEVLDLDLCIGELDDGFIVRGWN